MKAAGGSPEDPRLITAGHVKTYPDDTSAARASDNYRWFTFLTPPLRLPRLLDQTPRTLRFEHVEGRHAVPGDLVAVARHLGDVHATALACNLHQADLRVTLSMDLPDGRRHQIPGFLEGRVDAVARALSSGVVPSPIFDVHEACRRMAEACSRPAAFYKDTNPRNLLLPRTQSGTPTTIDFDDLTLAPFGYDLAKFVVSLAMTYGRLPDSVIAEALAAYNFAAQARHAGAPSVTTAEFMTWAEIHHILTSAYIGRHGYRHGWHGLRPRSLTPQSPAHDPGPTES